MLTLTIKDDKENREIVLFSENMKDLIDKELPKWLPRYNEDIQLIKKTKSYKINPQEKMKKEKESGWYYDL
jgi:hypothetical protein